MLDATKPAYPRTPVYEPGAGIWGGEEGISVRDHFASMFMAAFISKSNDSDYEYMSNHSVMAADALIRRLNER